MLRKEESGRTMLEMIGVITIVILLSISGLTLMKTSVTRMRVNNLLDATRKRAIAAANDAMIKNRFTEGLYDKESGAKPITFYGYGVGDNNHGAVRMKGYVKIPVGHIAGIGGRPVEAHVCEALKERVKPLNDASHGEIVGVYFYASGSCGATLDSCADGSGDPHEVICIGIKS